MARPRRGVRVPELERPAPGIGGRRRGAGEAMGRVRSISEGDGRGWSEDIVGNDLPR